MSNVTEGTHGTQRRRCRVDHVQVMQNDGYVMVTVTGENSTTAEFRTLSRNSPRAGDAVTVEFSWVSS